MKKIPLSGKHGKGYFALVDDHWYKFLMQWSWYRDKGGHALRSKTAYKKDGQRTSITVHMHRVVNKTPKNKQTDHIDRNGINNQEYNLRNATMFQNRRNSKRILERSNKTSIYHGVSWKKKNKKWVVQIHYIKKRHIGLFKSEIEAAKAYNKYAKKYYGRFACLNDV